jgi:hypothetical protein
LITGQIGVGLKQFHRVTPPIQVRCPNRSGPVERFEIGAGSSDVREKLHFSMRGQGRSVCSEVMGKKLAEEWPASLDPGLLCTRRGTRSSRTFASCTQCSIDSTSVAETAGCPNAAQDFLIGNERWQVEHSSVSPDRIKRRIQPVWCKASLAACLRCVRWNSLRGTHRNRPLRLRRQNDTVPRLRRTKLVSQAAVRNTV